jgi:hypothetical protein
MPLFSSKKKNLKQLPSTLEFSTELEIQCEKNEDGTFKIPTFKMLANTGVPMRLPNFEDKVIIDIAGFSSQQTIPALKDHKTEVGHTTKIEVDLAKHEITAEGILSVPNEEMKQIAAASKLGFPWQASVGASIVAGQASFLEEGETTKVNGRVWKGPLIVAHKTIGKELTITKFGADENTSVTVAANRIGANMNPFEKWLQANYCDPLGITLEELKLSDEKKSELEAKHEAELKASKTPPPVPGKKKEETKDPDLERIKAANELEAANIERIDRIGEIAASYVGVDMNEIYIKENLKIKGKTVAAIKGEAIRANWSADKFELECSRAERNDFGSHVITKGKPSFEKEQFAAISCALIREAGMTANEQVITTGCPNLPPSMQKYRKYGYENMFKEDVLEASDQFRGWSLCMLLDQANVQATGQRYSGRLGSDGFIRATRDSMLQIRAAGNTTWSGLDIFDDAANKLLWSAYDSIPTTWQNWVHQASVSDFKTSNIYRMHMDGGYKKVGADGLLKHGTLSDDKYTHAAETYGKMVGLNRQDLINDDLGALNRIMAALGIEGAKFLEELFYQDFLANQTTLFPVNDSLGNYISGAASDLTVDGLTLAERKFMDQTHDDAPIGLMGNTVLCGTQDAVIAMELFTQVALLVAQTVGGSAKGRPNQNPHVGKFGPVVSPYLNNTSVLQRIADPAGAAISNQSSDQWFLMPSPNSPMGAIMIGSFLNGNTRPIIEQADSAFDTLGLLWRAYHDAGSDNGDPKLAVHSKGAA